MGDADRTDGKQVFDAREALAAGAKPEPVVEPVDLHVPRQASSTCWANNEAGELGAGIDPGTAGYSDVPVTVTDLG